MRQARAGRLRRCYKAGRCNAVSRAGDHGVTVSENNPTPMNPLGLDGIEFVEFVTRRPQALGSVASDHTRTTRDKFCSLK